MARPQIFSRYDPDEGKYDYFVAADTGNHTPPRGPHPFLGTPAQDAAHRIPFGARYAGSGEHAIGRVAENGVNWTSVGRLALYALAAYGLWRLIRRR